MLVGMVISMAKTWKTAPIIQIKTSVTSGAVHGYRPNRGNFKTPTHIYKISP